MTRRKLARGWTTVDPEPFRRVWLRSVVAVMEKAGMRREKHGVQDSWHEELGWLDGYTYALLGDEWRTRQ